jgi:alkanesulfonate monooxygenase SsuD/methylene tetrahydromethanopterin reductase-like flavin-dependent oxidoreductase (luciferase family)
MQPSYQMLFGHIHEGMSDEDFVHNELRLAELAEPLGYSSIWCVEHHFDREYSMCPDNLQLLTYLAARTETIGLTTGAIILPWNDPLRVAEKISLLDILSHGRLSLGFGRGLSRSEYGYFGIDMEEARDRWMEAIEIVLGALRSGVAEGDGRYYPQPPAPIVPRSGRDLTDRIIEIAMSPESVEIAAKYGAGMATFIQFPIEKHKPLLDRYKEAFNEHHGSDGPPPTLTELISCHEDPEEARRLSHEHTGRYFTQLMRHYELAGDHFAGTKGYESYAAISHLLNASGMADAAYGYAESNTYGTPEEIVEKIAARRDVIGDYELNAVFSFGGVPFDTAEHGMRLFSEKVMPEVAKMGAAAAAA